MEQQADNGSGHSHGSIGVIGGTLIIRYTGWGRVDSAIAVGVGLSVLPRTWTLLKASMKVLLEGVPEGLHIAQVNEAILRVPDVDSVHIVHWREVSDT